MTAQTPAPIPAEVMDAAVAIGRKLSRIEMPLTHFPWVSRLVDNAIEAALTAVLPRVIADAEARDSLTRMLEAQRAWSTKTFGPGPRLKGVLDHIRKELTEVEEAPTDVTEWIDVVILALDGAWRSGHTPAEIVAALQAKYAINAARTWPDWRTASPDHAIEHDRKES